MSSSDPPPGADSPGGRMEPSTSSGDRQVTGSQAPATQGSSDPPRPTGSYACDGCGRTYQTRQGRNKHLKTCGSRDRTTCLYCDRQFTTFAGTRLHERSAHAAEYNRDLESSLKSPDCAIYSAMAAIEARLKKGTPFIGEMATATGLTIDQVRYRRSKPIYQQYLEDAKKKKAQHSMVSYMKPAAHPRRKSVAPTPTAAGRPPLGEITPVPPSPQQENASTSAALPATPPAPPDDEDPQVSKPPPSPPPKRKRDDRATSTSPVSPVVDLPPSKRRDPPPHVTPDAPPVPLTQTPEPGPSGLGLRNKRHRGELSSPDSSGTDVSPTARASPLAQRPRLHEPTPSPGGSAAVWPLAPRPPEPALGLNRSADDIRLSAAHEDPVGSFIRSMWAFREGLSDDGSHDLLSLINKAITGSQEEICAAISEWISSRFPRTRRNTRARAPPPTINYGGRHHGRGPKASAFKKAQDLFRKNPGSLAEQIISGTDLLAPTITPSQDDIEALYGGIFESRSPPDDEPVMDRMAPVDTSQPIQAAEVTAACSSWRPSAPGVDGILVPEVKKIPASELALVFTIILMKNAMPDSWRTLRTTLVPKTGNLVDPSNWRPITVSSALQRLLHRILAARLRTAVPLHPSQRGFTNLDGCLANTTLLDVYIRQRVARGAAYNVVSLDIRKAFDTVSHNSILRALSRAGVDPVTERYIKNTLTNNVTVIKAGPTSTRPISLRRGVKQGDPLSPLLFNLVLDEVLSGLHTGNNFGGSLGGLGIRVPVLAFADDLVVLDDADVHIPLVLGRIERFFAARGMSINAGKSFAIAAATRDHKSVPRAAPCFRVAGRWIPSVTALNPFRYLGLSVSSSGISRPSLANLPVWLANLGRAPLKPDQKFVLLKSYIIPKLLYGLQTPRTTGKTLRDVDRLIKHFVKTTLHLSSHTPDPYLYARVRDGGLGVVELRRDIPRIFLGRLAKLLDRSVDAPVLAALQWSGTSQLMSRLSHLAGEIPSSQHWRHNITAGATSRGLEQAASDSSSRHWIDSRPHGWTGRDYVRAVQLRTNNLPTAGLIYNPVDQRQCRAGCSKSETLSHVLQGCPATHWERIRRHNQVARRLAQHCRRGWVTEEEPHVRHPDGTLFKPDIAVHLPGGVVAIVDVGISWEGSIPLDQAFDNKKAVYDCAKFKEAASRVWPGKSLAFHPFIIGARGIMPKSSLGTAGVLGVGLPLRRSLVASVVKWGASIHAAFGRKVFRDRRRAAP